MLFVKPQLLLKILLIALVLYSSVSLGLSYLASSDWAEGMVREYFLPALRKEWGWSAAFDDILPAGFGAISVTNLRLTIPGQEPIKIGSISVQVDLARLLLMPWRWERSISKVTVTNLEAKVSRDQLSAESLGLSLGTGSGKQIDLDLVVVIQDGRVTLNGWPDTGDSLTVYDIEGAGRLTGSGVAWNLTAGNSLISVETTRVQGQVDWSSAQTSWQLRVLAKEVAARSYQESGVFPIPAVELQGGTGDVAITLRGRSGVPIEYVVDVALDEARGRTSLIPQELQKVTGRVRYDGSGLDFADLTGTVGGSEVSVSGRIWNWEDPKLDLRVNAGSLRLEDVDAALVYNNVSPFSQNEVRLSGEVQGDLLIVGPAKNPVFRGQLSIAGGAVHLASLAEPISDICGSVELRPGKAFLNLSLDWLGGEVIVAGQVSNLLDPILDLNLDADVQIDRAVELAVFPEALSSLGASGELHFAGQMTGVWKNPGVRGDVRISDFTLRGEKLGDLSLTGGYQDGRLAISELTIQQPQGGKLQVAGFLTSKSAAEGALLSDHLSEFALGVKLKEFDIGPLLAAIIDPDIWHGACEFFPEFNGISGSLLVKGDGANINNLVVSSTLEAESVKWRQTGLHQMAAGFSMSDGVFHLEYLNFFHPDPLEEAISANGEIVLGPDGFADATIDMSIEIESLDLAELGLAQDLSGKLSFHGHANGDLLDPTVVGDLSVEGPGWQAYAAETLVGEVEWAEGTVRISHGEVGIAGERVCFSGQMEFAPQFKLDLMTQVGNASLATLLSAYEGAPSLAGQVSGNVALSVGSGGVSGNGTLEASRVIWEGEEISRVSLEFEFADKTLKIRTGQAELLGGSLNASGTVSLSGWAMDLELSSIDAGKSALLKARDLAIAGVVSGKVQVRGELRDPQLLGTMAARDVAWREYRLDYVDGKVGYEDGHIIFSPVYLRRDQGQYALSGKIKVAGDPQMDLRVQLDRGSMHDVLSLLGVTAPKEVTGQLDGYVHLWGAAKAPTGRVYVSLNDGSAYGIPLEGDVDVTLYGPKIQVNRLRMEHGRGLLVGQGTLAQEGEIDFFLEGRAFPIASLCALLKAPVEIVGTADAELVLSGTAADPQARVAVNIAQTAIGGVGLGNIAGSFNLAGSRLTIDDLQVQGQDYRAQAQGYLDLPADIIGKLGVAGGKSRDGAEVKVAVRLPASEASFLVLLVPGLAVQQGTLAGEFSLAGTWAELKVAGSVNVKETDLTYPGLGTVEDVNLVATLEPGKIVINRLAGTIGGGAASASGEIHLEGLRPSSLGLKLVTDRVGYGNDMFSAVLTGNVTLEGPFAMPTIGGNVIVKEGKVQLKLPEKRNTPFNANLDLEIKTSDDIVVRGFGIDLMLAGAVHVGGTVLEPALDGKITATRGNVNYLGTKFALVHGSAEFAAARGLNPYLNVRGEAKMGEVDVTLLLQGTLDNLSTQFRSDPEMSDQELVAMLGWPERISSFFDGSDAEGELDQEMARFVEAELTRQFVGDLASTFQSALHLDDLQIKPSFMEKSIQVELGKYVLDDLYITYSSKLQEFSEQEWGLEYRLNPNVVLEGNIDSSGEKRVELKGKFSF